MTQGEHVMSYRIFLFFSRLAVGADASETANRLKLRPEKLTDWIQGHTQSQCSNDEFISYYMRGIFSARDLGYPDEESVEYALGYASACAARTGGRNVFWRALQNRLKSAKK